MSVLLDPHAELALRVWVVGTEQRRLDGCRFRGVWGTDSGKFESKYIYDIK